ncbi:hypothetical protein [Reichenbachiella sp. MSK19-1]|nr:hypothetical protein [Reichenbachiella sp. MSK19-1]
MLIIEQTADGQMTASAPLTPPGSFFVRTGQAVLNPYPTGRLLAKNI